MNLDSAIYERMAWIGTGLTAIAMTVVALLGNWYGSAVLAVFLLLSLLLLTVERQLPSLFDLLLVAAAVLNAAGWVWDIYQVGLYDEVAHAFTSFALTISLGVRTYLSVQVHVRAHGFLYALALFSFGMAIGGLWEIAEWTFGVIGTLRDTVVDLMMDATGALAAAVLARTAVRRLPEDQLQD